MLSGDSPGTLGSAMWKDMFQGEQFELPDTEFMKCLQKLLDEEQASQLITDIKASLNSKKARFCEAEYATVQDAQT